MYEIKESTIQKALKPFCVVSDGEGNIGFISEVKINNQQSDPYYQMGYRVCWLIKQPDSFPKNAWFYNGDLTPYCNLMVKISEAMCSPTCDNQKHVKTLLANL